MKEKKFLNKLLCFSLIFALLPWNAFAPVPVKADSTKGHPSYFIDTLLSSSGTYIVKTETDNNAFGESKEEKKLKSNYDIKETAADGTEKKVYVDWSTVDYSTPLGASAMLSKTNTQPELTDKTSLPFSFPAFQRKDENYIYDWQRADLVNSTLSSGLNQLIETAKNETNYLNLKIGSEDEKVANIIVFSRKLNPATSDSVTNSGSWTIVTFGNVKIYYASYNESTYKKYMDEHAAQYAPGKEPGEDGAKLIDEDGNLLFYIMKGNQEPEAGTVGGVWAMPKGYVNPVDGKNILNTDGGEKNYWNVGNKKQPDAENDTVGDARWLTIFSLAEYANAQAQFHNLTADSSKSGWNSTGSFIESTIYNMCYGIYSGLLSLLGLSTISDLVYNQGVRAGEQYESGLMNASWWNQVLKYHLIFQIIAWMMLILAVAKILLQVNFSTVNPQITISIMDTLQKIFTVGFALALCIPFIKVLASFNNYIVGIFETQSRGDLGNLATFGIAGIIILFGYLGITFTMNCIYVMRAIMIGILTASAPVFITSMAFAGPKQKGLFDNWLKELSANIFMQSVHAFALAFLFDIIDSSNILMQLIIYFSLLPIVDMCRQLIFGQAGGFAVAQGQKAADMTSQFVKSEVGGRIIGAANSKLGAYAKDNGIKVQGTDMAGSEGSTAGESKATSRATAFKNMAASVGDHLSQNGESKGQRLAGHALKGLSKAGDYLQSTGGIMGNAITRANMGDVSGSIQASKTHGEGVATAAERINHDIADAAENRAYSKNMENKDKYNEMATEFNNKAMEAQEKMQQAAMSGDYDAAQLFATQAAYNTSQSSKYSNKAGEAQEKIDKQKQRRGVYIDKSSGKTKISMNKYQGIKHNDGFTESALTTEQAKQIFGNNYKNFYNEETGMYYTGYNSVDSSLGSNRQIVIDDTKKLEKQIQEHNDWEYYHKPQNTTTNNILPPNGNGGNNYNNGGSSGNNNSNTDSNENGINRGITTAMG